MDRAVLLYDSECSLCVRFKGALELLDSKNMIDYKSIHDQSVYLDFPELDKNECEKEIHLVDPDMKVYRGSEVIEYLAGNFPAVKKISWLIESESGKTAMNAFYKRLNHIRLLKKRNCYTCGSEK